MSQAQQDTTQLIAQLQVEDRTKRDEVTTALVEQGERAVTPLLAALHHPSTPVRSHSATALGLIGDARAIEPLSQMLDNEDDDSEVCLTATVALGRLGDEETLTFCLEGLEDADSQERAGSAVALGLIGNKMAVEPLLKALRDQDNDVRCFAAAALGEIGDERAQSALEQTLQNATRLTPGGRKLRDTVVLSIQRLKEQQNK